MGWANARERLQIRPCLRPSQNVRWGCCGRRRIVFAWSCLGWARGYLGSDVPSFLGREGLSTLVRWRLQFRYTRYHNRRQMPWRYRNLEGSLLGIRLLQTVLGRRERDRALSCGCQTCGWCRASFCPIGHRLKSLKYSSLKRYSSPCAPKL